MCWCAVKKLLTHSPCFRTAWTSALTHQPVIRLSVLLNMMNLDMVFSMSLHVPGTVLLTVSSRHYVWTGCILSEGWPASRSWLVSYYQTHVRQPVPYIHIDAAAKKDRGGTQIPDRDTRFLQEIIEGKNDWKTNNRKEMNTVDPRIG